MEYLDDLEQRIRTALNTGDTTTVMRLGAILDEQDKRKAQRLAGTTLGSAACWYAEQGIDVFPLQPRGKRPATAHGLHDASHDIGQVWDWWKAMPTANIGLPTGRMFDVIDIDGPTGAASMTACQQCLPEACVAPEHDSYTRIAEVRAISIGHVLTPRPGGSHLYIPPAGHGNKAGLYPGVDYRGIGGYVVAPPSLTDDHGPGLAYRWIRQLQIGTV